MILLYILLSPVLFVLGFVLLMLGFIFYPFHQDMIGLVAWVASRF